MRAARLPRFVVVTAAALGLANWGAAARRVFLPVLSGEQSVHDLRCYLDASRRLIEDPHRLYERPEGGYIYPPPVAALFVPLTHVSLAVACALVLAASVAAMLACWWLVVRSREAETGARLPSRVRWELLVLVLAFAPLVQSAKLGQINALVLLAGLGFLRLLQLRRGFSAGLVLSAGAWLKLYPLLLAGLGLGRGRTRPYLAGWACGLAGVVLLCLPLVPLQAYATYVADVVPQLGALTNLSGSNQSLVALIERFHVPLATLAGYEYIAATPAARLGGMVAAALLVGACYAAHLGARPSMLAGLALLAVPPLVSPLGWEHTFLLVLPLALWLLLATRHDAVLGGLTAAAALVFYVPKLPDGWLAASAGSPWAWLWYAFYARYAVADLVLVGVALALAWRSSRASPIAESARA